MFLFQYGQYSGGLRCQAVCIGVGYAGFDVDSFGWRENSDVFNFFGGISGGRALPIRGRLLCSPTGNVIIPISSITSPIFSRGVVNSKFTIVPASKGVCSPTEKGMLDMFPAGRTMNVLLSDKLRLLLRVNLSAIRLGKGPFRIFIGRNRTLATSALVTGISLTRLRRTNGSSTVIIIVAGVSGIGDFDLSIAKRTTMGTRVKDILPGRWRGRFGGDFVQLTK